MSDYPCNLCGENKDEDYGVSYDNKYDFECNDCRAGECGVCEKPVKGGTKAKDVIGCTHCGNYMHETCVIKNSKGEKVRKNCI